MLMPSRGRRRPVMPSDLKRGFVTLVVHVRGSPEVSNETMTR